MRLNRGTFLGALAGLVAGAMLVSVLPVLAANGEPMILGQENTADRTTKLISKRGLTLINKGTGRAGLYIKVKPGSPPILVNSDGLVENLNADL